jgi:hypothetical protein
LLVKEHKLDSLYGPFLETVSLPWPMWLQRQGSPNVSTM